ncbi:DegV family protein [Clostridiaceae bacterium OttesenSCG-928-D20]|nr:DegV family protein [Clostridiaceae bacterium OttesenSCG-928-D20]
MDYKIIVDSCCDLTEELEEKLGAATVSLSIHLGEDEYRDDRSLEIKSFMAKMKECTSKIGTSAPSPGEYRDAFVNAKHAFCLPITSKLSASYSSAKAGQALAHEEGVDDIHVFDTESATAGQVLLAVKIRELLDNGFSKSDIISKIDAFIKEMKTYFVLENHDNLIKNGRMSKITSKLLGALDIKLIMKAKDGAIASAAKTRGEKKMLERIIELIRESGRKPEENQLVITHCNNDRLADILKELIKTNFNFKEIIVLHTRGIATVYADDQGIVMAF